MIKCYRYCVLLLCFLGAGANCLATPQGDRLSFFGAENPLFQYVGRIDFTNPQLPRFWSPGVYITAKFKGSFCEIQLNDQQLWGRNQNYLEVVIDGEAQRLQTTGKTNRIVVARGLENKEHWLVICKNTESNIGYLEFVGITCAALLPLPVMPARKIEFIGNSITCGTGSDESAISCGKGNWQDQHNAYLSYGALSARALNAQWVLSAVSGIGLVRSCCNMNITMPEVFNKIDMRGDSLQWDFRNYQPDVVTICLGQNDGVQDSVIFCNEYLKFLSRLRTYYPTAKFILLNSPTADAPLNAVLKKFATSIAQAAVGRGDKRVSTFFFSKRYNKGCDSHPNLEEHAQMADELTACIKTTMNW